MTSDANGAKFDSNPTVSFGHEQTKKGGAECRFEHLRPSSEMKVSTRQNNEVDQDKLNAAIAKLERSWRPFLERIADAEHPLDPSRPGCNEAWFQLVNHLNGLAAAYVAWQGQGRTINEYGPVDDARFIELIEPCIRNEADRRVFLATCKRLADEWRELNESEPEPESEEE